MGEWSEYFEDFPGENSANYALTGSLTRKAQRHCDQQRLGAGRIKPIWTRKSAQSSRSTASRPLTRNSSLGR